MFQRSTQIYGQRCREENNTVEYLYLEQAQTIKIVFELWSFRIIESETLLRGLKNLVRVIEVSNYRERNLTEGTEKSGSSYGGFEL